MKSKWCFSNNSVAPRDDPMLIPKAAFFCQPAFSIAFLEAAIANKTELSSDLYLLSDFFNSLICFLDSQFNGAIAVF
jgi:hypothetical protein